MREVAQLSVYEDGPRRAQERLAAHGIALVIERHLPRTHLDGAALCLLDGRPVIGLTLRYDRIDNFWFSLMHELAHVSLHLDCHEKRPLHRRPLLDRRGPARRRSRHPGPGRAHSPKALANQPRAQKEPPYSQSTLSPAKPTSTPPSSPAASATMRETIACCRSSWAAGK